MNLGPVAFWLFVAAVVVAVQWRKKHREEMRHQTIRFMIEKNQKLDEKQIAELLNPNPQPPEWFLRTVVTDSMKPGSGYRGMRIVGTILLFVALGLALMAVWQGIMLGMYHTSVREIGLGVPMVAMLGIGFFVASRFMPRDKG